MKIQLLIDSHLRLLAASRGGAMQAVLNGSTYAPVPAELASEIGGMQKVEGIYIYEMSEVNKQRIIDEIRYNENELVPTEANLSFRHLEDYVSNSINENDCLAYFMVGLGAASLIRAGLDAMGEKRVAKFYLSGSRDSSGDWFHTFRFHLVRADEADWQDHLEFVDEASALDNNSYYGVLML